MKAIALSDAASLVARINAIRAASPYYLDPVSISPLTTELRAVKRDIDRLFQIDACVAWELTGTCSQLTGDRDDMERAFANSVALGDSGTNRLNWMVNRLNLGMFSAAQELYSAIGSPENGRFGYVLLDGFKTGAITQAARFAERAREMHIPWDEISTEDLTQAHAMLQEAGVTDDQIASQLDVAGEVLHRHRIRPKVVPKVSNAPGIFEGVTFALIVPVSTEEAFDMNAELAVQENETGIERNPMFDVVFQAAA